jgi:ubiquitin-conjugating enzyme E2 Q
MFLEDDSAPDSIARVIQNLPQMKGYSLEVAITHVAETIFARDEPTTRQSSIDEDLIENDNSDNSDILDGFDAEDYESDDDESSFFNKPQTLELRQNEQLDAPQSSGEDIFNESEKHLILLDFAAAKTAGFKVACYGNVFCSPHNFYMCLSIRVSKLGISKDAMEAWNVEPMEYLVLAFCYKAGYKRLNAYIEMPELVTFKIGLSKTYRPPYHTIVKSFAKGTADSPNWRATFISKPLEEMMNKAFFYILKNRSSGLNWTQAENLFRIQSGGFNQYEYAAQLEQLKDQADLPSGMYPDVVHRDHIPDAIRVINQEISFPLVAMQFFLRHFVRCTEFCLVCHCPLHTTAEAIKPYVCENPLCLYQYMSLGFGPGIEHEILTQPNVVDLLISFAWAAAKPRRLKQLPLGLGLMVPSIPLLQLKGEEFSSTPYFARQPYPIHNLARQSVQTPPQPIPVPEDPYKGCSIRLDLDNHRVIFEKGKPHGLISGSWIALSPGLAENDESSLRHCRILKTYPDYVEVSSPMLMLDGSLDPQTGIVPVRVVKYDQNFDELPRGEALASLYLQINLLPSVAEMEDYLRGYAGRYLASWNTRLSPTAVSILRWILASNRACIMEENQNPLVKEMPSMKQFRFAMGAPVGRPIWLHLSSRILTSVGQRAKICEQSCRNKSETPSKTPDYPCIPW